ncbi:TetR/AcrR family transcriptional regulator [Cellulomonas dongxiuzhuiae]|uniref:TetR family transcriptional regulator n=1 Tax=Cellulomonas dongxiuzhuiae TaxID=2819979 RepID=A0ABX8GLY8_9CELL|nr:TetR family transcriptional regulator [Cellulomonas dongxiuzhuiae]MBO3088717.1 TetR family transcriptional regulator [Cellulomonas dongxiuzhuiae]MBO3096275.1 TetR family transcriptional regulator [Cellulomonas dongxiuzhuiae]QWC16696.1 TetR family transcriptional regulator [Cellulomonas dongxiuzhuiae]
MNRLPVAERREQLIEAALTVASREGIDGATVRAVAAEAGVSLGVVHYCFRDKDELLRAMAHTITERNLGRGVAAMPESAPARDLVMAVLDELWSNIRATRGPQLLTYELTTTSLRHPELQQVGVDQYVVSWAAAERFLEEVERAAGIVWRVPRHLVARSIIATIDGFCLAWLVDGDDDAAYQGLRLFAEHLSSLAVPVDEAAMLGGTADDDDEPRAEVHPFAAPSVPSGVSALA